MGDTASEYNLPGFVFGKSAPAGPGDLLPIKVGGMAPDFEATTLDGGTIRLSEMKGKRHVVLMMGCVTSPMCAIEVPEMNVLSEEFKSRDVSTFLVYTREAHPADVYRHHTTWQQKVAHARDFQRLEQVQIPIIVDDLSGAIHRSYGVWPNSLFVVHRDGRLVYRSNMANTRELRQFLDDLLAAERMQAKGKMIHMEYSERIVGREANQETHRRVYERAGPKALEDYWTRKPELRDRWP